MSFTPLTKDCADGRTCPGVRATGRGTVIVQGPGLADKDLAEITLGPGEIAVEIPAEILLEAARAYRG